MSFPFFPDIILPALTDITPEMLTARGIDFLMLDFDNTIVPYTTDVPTEEMRAWLARMQKSEIGLCVVSNSKRDRVRKFCQTYGLDWITHAKKPFLRGIRECLATYNLSPERTALVGDQIYTDVLGAKSGGLTAILVTAIHNHNILLKLRHVAELPFIGLARLKLARQARRRRKNTGKI